jgi:hypothetical protein
MTRAPGLHRVALGLSALVELPRVIKVARSVVVVKVRVLSAMRAMSSSAATLPMS